MKSGIETKISFVSQLFSCIIALEVTVLFCMKCTTDYVSFDDFIGDAFDEGVRHRRPGFHKVPPIKRKVEKVFILLISVNSLKESCPHSAKMSSKATSIVPLFAEPSGTDATQRPRSPCQWFRRERTRACRTHT